MTSPQPTASRLIDAYETACTEFSTSIPTTATWRAYRNTGAALLDYVERFGPVFRAGAVYAPSRTGLVVIRGVRTCEEMEREAAGQVDHIPTAEEVAAVLRKNSVKAWWKFYDGLSVDGKRAARDHRDTPGN